MRNIIYDHEHRQFIATIEAEKKKIDNLQNSIKELRTKIRKYKMNTREIENYKERYNKLQSDLHAFDTNIKSNIGRINLILDSLTNALMSRKKLVEEY